VLTGCFVSESERRSCNRPFHVADWVLLKAVVAAGQELKVPVVVGASEGEREFIGVQQIAALVRSLREEYDSPIFLNADHTHSLAKAVEAARAGFDAIVFDLSALPFEQNVRQTKEAVETLKTIDSSILSRGRDRRYWNRFRNT
jgi:fructose-bisphosphate aldolase, class II